MQIIYLLTLDGEESTENMGGSSRYVVDRVIETHKNWERIHCIDKLISNTP